MKLVDLEWRRLKAAERDRKKGGAPVRELHIGKRSLLEHYTYRLVRAHHDQGRLMPTALMSLLECAFNQDRRPSVGKGDVRNVSGLWAAEDYLAANPDASDRAAGRHAGVDHKTIAAWKRNGYL